MNTQMERTNVAVQPFCRASAFGYLAAGLGIGAALSIFLAPKSGEQTRKWIADKCLDAVESTNEKIRDSRANLKVVLDRGQNQVAEAVTAGREMLRKAKVTPAGAQASVGV